jgi:glyoxalase family protein
MGLGSVHHFALTVKSMDGLLKWKTWLQHHHLLVAGPFDHGAYRSLLVTDPDGVVVEIATRTPGWSAARAGDSFMPPSSSLPTQTWPEPVTEIADDMRLGVIHHIAALTSDINRTNEFYEDVMAIPRFRESVDPDMKASPRWYWSTGEGSDAGMPGTLIIYTQPKRDDTPIRGQVGHGMTHHFAFDVEDDTALTFWRERVLERGLTVTDILDRKYFHSIYFHDPDDILIEIATSDPGFLVDEPADRLGDELMLPPWLEGERASIESSLEPIALPA